MIFALGSYFTLGLPAQCQCLQDRCMERKVYCYSKNASEMAKHMSGLPFRIKDFFLGDRQLGTLGYSLSTTFCEERL